MHSLDWVVLIAYLVVITAIGLIAGYQVRHSADYFLGGRRFGPWLMIGQSFGVGTHAEMPVALAGAVYSVGASAIWFQWKNLFITPFYWLMAPVFRRIRRTTMAEFTEDRYGPWMGGIYVVFALCFFIINTGSMLKGAGKVISQATGGTIGVNEIVVAMTVMFILYSFVGGLVAAAWTDLFQGFLIIVLSFMLIPLGWTVVGGIDGLRGSLEPFRFSLATPSGITPWVIAMLTINGLVGIMAQPHQLATVGTGRDERTCRVGMVYGNMVKRVCTVGWALVGLIVSAMIVQGRGPALGRRRGCVRLRLPSIAVSRCARLADRVGARRQHVHLLGVPRRQRRAVHGGRVPPAARAQPSRQPLPLDRADQRLRHHHAGRALRDLPDPERAVYVPAHRDDGHVRRHQRARRHPLAAGQSLGRTRQHPRRDGHELPPLLPHRPAARSLGRQRVPRGAGRRAPSHSSPSAC